SHYALPIILHPPIPTLFPYTTLFRSALETKSSRRPGAVRPRCRNQNRRAGSATCQGNVQQGARNTKARAHSRAGERASRGGTETDRKSTRLNSSHVSISYAVFCLKQK